MSTPEEKTGLTQPRSAEVWDDDIDLLEAMLFAQAHATSLNAPAKGEASNDRGDATESAEADEDTQVRESPAVIERRLAMAREFKELASLGEGGPMASPSSVEAATKKPADGNARDSLITVPPTTHTVPPVAIPALPIVVISDAAPDPTVPWALTTRVFAAALKARVVAAALTALREGSLRRGTWATWMITIAVALPGGLLLGHALSSHQTAVGTVESAAGASQAPPEPDPLTTGADSASQPSSAIPPTTDVAAATSSAQSPVYSDGPALVIMPRPSHHGKRRSAPKPADSSRSAGSSASASPVSSIPAH